MQDSAITDIVLPMSLFIIMFGMGLSLTIADFKRVFVYPKAVLLGTLGQIILLPIVGFVVASCFAPTPELAVGIMLLAACPGGTTSNLMTHLAKGDSALSITLTAVSSLITIISIPVIVVGSMSYFMSDSQQVDLPVLQTIGTLLTLTLLPVSLGMLFLNKKKELALMLEPKINIFSGIFLAFLVVAISVEQREILVSSILSIGPAAMALNFSTVLLGYLLAKTFSLNRRQTISVSVEVGVQNSALAILIATTILHTPVLAIPPAIYSLVMYLSGGIIIGLSRNTMTSRTVDVEA